MEDPLVLFTTMPNSPNHQIQLKSIELRENNLSASIRRRDLILESRIDCCATPTLKREV
jgi:hypothetical protein